MIRDTFAGERRVVVTIVGVLDGTQALKLRSVGLDAVARARDEGLPLVFDLGLVDVCDADGAASLAEIIGESIRAQVDVRLSAVSVGARENLELHGLGYFVRTRGVHAEW